MKSRSRSVLFAFAPVVFGLQGCSLIGALDHHDVLVHAKSGAALALLDADQRTILGADGAPSEKLAAEGKIDVDGTTAHYRIDAIRAADGAISLRWTTALALSTGNECEVASAQGNVVVPDLAEAPSPHEGTFELPATTFLEPQNPEGEGVVAYAVRCGGVGGLGATKFILALDAEDAIDLRVRSRSTPFISWLGAFVIGSAALVALVVWIFTAGGVQRWEQLSPREKRKGTIKLLACAVVASLGAAVLVVSLVRPSERERIVYPPR